MTKELLGPRGERLFAEPHYDNRPFSGRLSKLYANRKNIEKARIMRQDSQKQPKQPTSQPER